MKAHGRIGLAYRDWASTAQEQHSFTNLEKGLKAGPSVIGLKRGDYVEVINVYISSAYVGSQAKVIKAWVDPSGNEWAKLHFGKNLGGQSLRQTYPANALKKIAAPTPKNKARINASLDASAEPVQALDRTREQGPSTLPRATIFQVMGMLRSAKGMLNGLYPAGAEGGVRKAQDSIESAHWALNKVTSKFAESVQEQSGKIVWTQKDKAVSLGSADGWPHWTFVIVAVGSAITGAAKSPQGKEWRLSGNASVDRAKQRLQQWLDDRGMESFREAALVMDSAYKGQRWTYGLNYRPVGYAQIPDGWIVMSDRKDSRFNHGTIDYPFELPAGKIKRFEMTPVTESVREQVDHWTPQDARELKAGKFRQQGPEWIRLIGDYTLKIWMVSPGDWKAQAIGPGRKATVSATGAKDAVAKTSTALMKVTESVQEQYRTLADMQKRDKGNDVGPLEKPWKGAYGVRINGDYFDIFSEVVDYQTTGDMKPILEWFIIGSHHSNPTGQKKMGMSKTPRGVVGKLKKLRFRIVKGSRSH